MIRRIKRVKYKNEFFIILRKILMSFRIRQQKKRTFHCITWMLNWSTIRLPNPAAQPRWFVVDAFADNLLQDISVLDVSNRLCTKRNIIQLHAGEAIRMCSINNRKLKLWMPFIHHNCVERNGILLAPVCCQPTLPMAETKDIYPSCP